MEGAVCVSFCLDSYLHDSSIFRLGGRICCVGIRPSGEKKEEEEEAGGPSEGPQNPGWSQKALTERAQAPPSVSLPIKSKRGEKGRG